ncbi:hypothetical protein J6590_092046 [Homalodisca vitripennis]|nr:hypothetical protein J6590_092046 [Homalodisca vitripennis]
MKAEWFPIIDSSLRYKIHAIVPVIIDIVWEERFWVGAVSCPTYEEEFWPIISVMSPQKKGMPALFQPLQSKQAGVAGPYVLASNCSFQYFTSSKIQIDLSIFPCT